MKRLTFASLLALICSGAIAAAGASAHAGNTLCVGSKPGCFTTVQAAVDAAHDGDTIKIGPGTFAGGVTIDVSIDLLGAGAGKSVIAGGGPVLSIGRQDGPRRTVSIRGLTITGGNNSSVPDTVVSFGGGVSIPFSSGFTTGATVTIADSVISGNRVNPQMTATFCGSPCAFAFGGGIDNAGTLTVTNSRIVDNEAGSATADQSVASGAGAGGIFNEALGTLTMRHSFVIGNRAAVGPPNGASAVAGGIDGQGPLTIEDSVVSGNRLDTTNLTGFLEAFAGGILAQNQATLILKDSAVEHNHVSASLSSAEGGFIFNDAGGVEADVAATITNTRIVANSVEASAPAGTVIAVGGGLAVGFHNGVTVRNSLIAGNTVATNSAGGTPISAGGGVQNYGTLTLERTLVIGNSAAATGPGGIVHGGGISNETFPGDTPPMLTLTDSVITANRLSSSPGVTPQGGGLFTTDPVTLTRTVIAGNKPDQCFGC